MRCLPTALIGMLLCGAVSARPTAGASALCHPAPAGSSAIVYVHLPPAKSGDVLTGASAAVATATELHEMTWGAPDSMHRSMAMAAPSGTQIDLRGRRHVMLEGLHAALRKGERFPLVMTFEHGERVTVTVHVVTAPAGG